MVPTPAGPGSTPRFPGLGGGGVGPRDACLSDGRGVEAVLTEQGRAALANAAPTHVAGVRQFFVDLVDDEDFEAVGRVFDAVTDRLIEANPALDIR